MSEQERHTTPWRACFGEKMIRTYITNGERTIYTSKDDADFLVAALNTAVRSETAAPGVQSAVGARYGIGELRTNDYATALLQAAQELLDGSVRMRVFSFDADGLPARLAKRIEKHLSAPRSASVARSCPYCTSDNEAIRDTYYDQTCEGCVKRMGR